MCKRLKGIGVSGNIIVRSEGDSVVGMETQDPNLTTACFCDREAQVLTG